MLKTCDHNFIDKRRPQTPLWVNSLLQLPRATNQLCGVQGQAPGALLFPGHTSRPGSVSVLVTEESNYIQWVLGPLGSCYFGEAEGLYPLTHWGWATYPLGKATTGWPVPLILSSVTPGGSVESFCGGCICSGFIRVFRITQVAGLGDTRWGLPAMTRQLVVLSPEPIFRQQKI